MDTSYHPTTGNTQNSTPKYTTQQIPDASPPPYTPRRPSFAGVMARGVDPSQFTHRLGQGEPRVFNRPLVTTVLPNEQEDAEASGTLSSLSLRINTAINISKSNNLVCLSDSPANHANVIAEAVAQAIQKNSSGNCGIPMIDGNGNPRPIKMEVDAGMVVDGMGNVVGNEKIIDEVLRQRGELRRQDLRRQRDDTERTDPEPHAKRRRSE